LDWIPAGRRAQTVDVSAVVLFNVRSVGGDNDLHFGRGKDGHLHGQGGRQAEGTTTFS
jgi:hypothetical protein